MRLINTFFEVRINPTDPCGQPFAVRCPGLIGYQYATTPTGALLRLAKELEAVAWFLAKAATDDTIGRKVPESDDRLAVALAESSFVGWNPTGGVATTTAWGARVEVREGDGGDFEAKMGFFVGCAPSVNRAVLELVLQIEAVAKELREVLHGS